MKDWLWKNKLILVTVLLILLVGYWFGRRTLPPIQPLPFDAPSETGFVKSEPTPDTLLPSPPPPSAPSVSERLVVKAASLSLLVKNVRESAEKMQKLASDLGGFVVDSNISVIDEKKGTLTATVTIRVPDEKFDEALKVLKEQAVKVTGERVSGQDVTEQYTDLQSRLRNLEATEAQLLKIMERAGEIKDVLAVQQELTRVREQVETTKGRIKFLEESAALSSITAYFATEEKELPIVEERWRPLVTAKAALRSLVSFWQSIADRLIFWGIFLAPVLAPLFVIWFWKKRK